MSISTKTPINRKERIEELFKEHEHKFKTLDIDDPLFIPKCAYKPKSGADYVVSFFPSELKRAKDIYLEFTSIDLEPEDPNRILYKWRFNPHYAEEYEVTEPTPKGDVRYLVPVSELIKIEVKMEDTLPKDAGLFPDFEEIMDPNSDAPLSQMTIRDLAAILMTRPVSQKKWLNDLIVNKDKAPWE